MRPYQPSFWEMAEAQFPHLMINLIGWPVLSYYGTKMGQAIATRMPWMAGMAPHIGGALPMVGTMLASLLWESTFGNPLTAKQLQQQMALQRMAEIRQQRQQLMNQILSQPPLYSQLLSLMQQPGGQ